MVYIRVCKILGFTTLLLYLLEITNIPLYLHNCLLCHHFFVICQINLLTKSGKYKYNGRLAIVDEYNGILVKPSCKIWLQAWKSSISMLHREERPYARKHGMCNMHSTRSKSCAGAFVGADDEFAKCRDQYSSRRQGRLKPANEVLVHEIPMPCPSTLAS
jgi:hypothetical protein